MEFQDWFLSHICIKRSFKEYLIFVIIAFTIFLLINFYIQSIPFQAIDYGKNVTFNKTAELVKMYQDYAQNQIPKISNSFFDVFIKNLISSFLILFLPIVLFLFISLSLLKRDKRSLKISLFFCKVFVFVYMFFYIDLTFKLLFYIFILPFNSFLISYTHAFFEVPAMILAFTFTLILIDEVYEILINAYASSLVDFQISRIDNIKIKITIFLAKLLI